jgi:hypothetical protein
VLHRESWRDEFTAFAETIAGSSVYITVDLDCLRSEDSITNWESGMFTPEEVAWGIGQISQRARIIGGDVCGAYSPQQYARFRQRIEGFLDHPKAKEIDLAEAARRNERARALTWAALTAGE